jgi:hypothetical protein
MRYTQKMQGIALGIPSLRGIFDEKFYTDLPGGLLESLGRLFEGSTKLYAYPFREPVSGQFSEAKMSQGETGIWMREAANGQIVTADNLQVAPHLRHLYAHLLENGHIVSIQNYTPEYLSLFPPFVLSKIQSGDASWERDVPPQIVGLIKGNKMFGWQEKASAVTA